jgi:hypothetical protein
VSISFASESYFSHLKLPFSANLSQPDAAANSTSKSGPEVGSNLGTAYNRVPETNEQKANDEAMLRSEGEDFVEE